MEAKKKQLSPANQEPDNAVPPSIRAKEVEGSSVSPRPCSFIISFADPIPVKKFGNKVRGNFNHLKWSRPEQIASRMKSLVEECFPECSVRLEAELEAQDGRLGFGLAVEVENGDPSKIEPIAFTFAKRIKSGQTGQEDLFVHDADEFQDIVSKHVGEFLGANGNLNIGSPLSIRGGNLNLQMAGKFESPPNHLPARYDPIRFKGAVDGFQKTDRIVHLISEEGVRFKAHFDLQFFIGRVGAAALDDNLVEITLLPKENAKGRLVYELTEIGACREAHEPSIV